LKERRVSKKFTKHSGVSPSLLLVLKASQLSGLLASSIGKDSFGSC
jgi:hypothetical protein